MVKICGFQYGILDNDFTGGYNVIQSQMCAVEESLELKTLLTEFLVKQWKIRF